MWILYSDNNVLAMPLLFIMWVYVLERYFFEHACTVPFMNFLPIKNFYPESRPFPPLRQLPYENY